MEVVTSVNCISMKLYISPANYNNDECKSVVDLLTFMYSKYLKSKNIDHSLFKDELSGHNEIEFNANIDFESEYGIHRIVRLSPFDSKNRRHTSWVSVRQTRERPITFNRPIRSYVFSPYQLVKNLQNGKQTELIEEVLNGNIDLVR